MVAPLADIEVRVLEARKALETLRPREDGKMNSIAKAVGVSLGGLVMGASLFVGFVYGIVIATVDDDPQLDWEDDQS